MLPIAGRGSATWKVAIRREGPPVHEVMRPARRAERDRRRRRAGRAARPARRRARRASPHPVCGPASVFIGQIHAGEIYNQYPQEAWLEGTRRWLPGTDPASRRARLPRRGSTARRRHRDDDRSATGCLIRDAFALDPADPLVAAFQRCYQAISGSHHCPPGPSRSSTTATASAAMAGVPAITHGPRAGGQHTVSEWVEIDDLVRVALLYAATAVDYCC